MGAVMCHNFAAIICVVGNTDKPVRGVVDLRFSPFTSHAASALFAFPRFHLPHESVSARRCRVRSYWFVREFRARLRRFLWKQNQDLCSKIYFFNIFLREILVFVVAVDGGLNF